MGRWIYRILWAVSLLLGVACGILWIRGLTRGDFLCFMPHPSSLLSPCCCLATRPHGLAIVRGVNAGTSWWTKDLPQRRWNAFTIPWEKPITISLNRWSMPTTAPGLLLPGTGPGFSMTAVNGNVTVIGGGANGSISITGGTDIKSGNTTVSAERITLKAAITGPTGSADHISIKGGIQSTEFSGTLTLFVRPPPSPQHHLLGFGWDASTPALLTAGLLGFWPRWQIVIPWWFLIFLCSIVPLTSVHQVLRQRHRRKHGLCLICGYDLRASPERCPECGTAISAPVVGQGKP